MNGQRPLEETIHARGQEVNLHTNLMPDSVLDGDSKMITRYVSERSARL